VSVPEPEGSPPSAEGAADPDVELSAGQLLEPSLTPPPSEPGVLVVRHPGPGEEDLRRAAVISTYGSPFQPRTPEEAALWAALIPPTNRLVVAERFADGSERFLGGAGRYDTALSLPGGARVPVGGLTAVGVTPGEQHRGAFRALCEAHLDECRDRGDAASVLMASETPLYRRFGYGCATQSASWEIDGAAARRLHPDAPSSGRVILEHGRGQRLTDLLHEVWEAAGSRRSGSLTRSPKWWERVMSAEKSWLGGGALLVGLHWADGRCDGYVLYDVDSDHGRQALAESTITVRELVAVDVAAELDLWRFVTDLPWSRVIRWTYGPIDPAPLFWLEDGRALRRMWHADFLWLRPLDLVALAERRGFAADGVVALEVSDPRYSDIAGRFDLVARDGYGEWAPGSGPAELTLSVGDLGALWLGDVSALRMVGVRRITGDPRAAGRLDAMLAAEAAPRSLARF
jgi:predicted acetyltransferase